MKKSIITSALLICACLLVAQTAKCQDLIVRNNTSCTLEMQLTIWQTVNGQQLNGLLIPPGATLNYPLYMMFPTASPGSFWSGFKAMNPCMPPSAPGVDLLGVEPSTPNDAMSVTPCIYMGVPQNCGYVKAVWTAIGGGNVTVELL